MNKVLLIGRITKDPECRYTQSGTAYLGFVLAVNRKQKDANGKTISDFITCKAFGNNADFIGKYIKKGNLLAIEGTLQSGQYKNQQGQTVYTTDVLIESVENLTPREQSATNPQPSATPQYQNQNNGGYQQHKTVDDDLPF